MTQVYGSCSVALISSRLLLFFIGVHLNTHMLMLNMSCVVPSLTMSIGCTACVLFLSLLRLASIILISNLVTIARHLAAVPADVLAANRLYDGWVHVINDEREVVKLHCAAVTSHFASLGKVSAMPSMTFNHQVILGAGLGSPWSCAIVLFDILGSRSLEPHLPPLFVGNMLSELGIGLKSLIQLNSTFQQKGKHTYLTVVCSIILMVICCINLQVY